ncbi:MAG: hypothetical protein EOO05_13270 [Chitinophagaceae bacterium]|nr:MAG: hypothetical protein EOO05_13270 [Chitinophagaceae bacterium]
MVPNTSLTKSGARLVLLLALAMFSGQTFSQDIENIPLAKPVTVSGNIDLRGIAYSADGIPARRKPFSYILSGYTNINLYGSLDIPISFTLSEQDRSFSQPFNQFGLSPRYKWLTIHGGYRNLSFSPYTLDGHTMLGAGIEINPKKFHFGIMYGRLNRATEIDSTIGTVQPFSFSRKGIATKIGYGDERSFITLSTLHAKDDSSSTIVDPGNQDLVRAAANSVASLAGRLQLAKGLYLDGDAGASLWTNDIGSAYAIPDSNRIIDKLSSLMPVNGTSEFSVAYRAAAGYMGKFFGLKFEFKHIDPQFRSMGVYYFNNDVESYTVSPSFILLKNRLRINGSIGRQKDNVKSQKEATTTRTIGLANVSWDITQRLGIDANYTNFSSNSKPSVVLVQNKYLLAQNNSNISVMPRLVISNTRFAHVVIASFNRSDLTDDNSTTQTTNNITSDILALNYTISLVQKALSITTAITHTSNTLSVGEFKNMSYTAGLNKSWFKNKLLTTVNGTYTTSKGPQGNSNIINANFNSSYQAGKHHRFSIRYSLLDNRPEIDNAGQIKFREHTGEAAYTYSF